MAVEMRFSKAETFSIHGLYGLNFLVFRLFRQPYGLHERGLR